MTIRIITTGGTIDGLNYDSPEKAHKKHKTLIPLLMKQARVTLKYSVEELFAKDSRLITDEDRELLLKKCLESGDKQIVITHGTATLSRTAKFLGKNSVNKTIVLVGSMIPANEENSDALFNLGAAITAVQSLPVGVYIAMNGRIFSWDNAKKNMEKGIFETEK